MQPFALLYPSVGQGREQEEQSMETHRLNKNSSTGKEEKKKRARDPKDSAPPPSRMMPSNNYYRRQHPMSPTPLVALHLQFLLLSTTLHDMEHTADRFG